VTDRPRILTKIGAWVSQPVDTYPYYAMVQAQCDSSTGSTDQDQRWSDGGFFSQPNLPSGPYAEQLFKFGANVCLWAPSAQAGNGGGLFLVPCDANDRNQLWIAYVVPLVAPPVGSENSAIVFQNVGTGTCIDADGTYGGRAGDRVWQWSCKTDGSDPFQEWAIGP